MKRILTWLSIALALCPPCGCTSALVAQHETRSYAEAAVIAGKTSTNPHTRAHAYTCEVSAKLTSQAIHAGKPRLSKATASALSETRIDCADFKSQAAAWRASHPEVVK